MIQQLNQWLSTCRSPRISLDEGQLAQFGRYLDLLMAWNERMNLTAITEPQEVIVKHFYDSLTPMLFYPFSGVERLIDVGTGAGFPGIPLKIALPQLQLTLLDSLKKRLTFLQEVIEQLNLCDVTFIHARAEDLGHHPKHRQQYDVAISRAVARLNVLSEYCLPFVRVGGSFIAMKGSQAKVEKRDAASALSRLGGDDVKEFSFALPHQAGERTLFIINKTLSTPKSFPRQAGLPAKQPL